VAFVSSFRFASHSIDRFGKEAAYMTMTIIETTL
jgi:hypothetical protein